MKNTKTSIYKPADTETRHAESYDDRHKAYMDDISTMISTPGMTIQGISAYASTAKPCITSPSPSPSPSIFNYKLSKLKPFDKGCHVFIWSCFIGVILNMLG